MRRAAIIVLDGLGIGAAHDTDQYGDTCRNPLGQVIRVVGRLNLPQMEEAGWGRCAPVQGLSPAVNAAGAWGVCEPASPGKDSTTGHWELCGVILEHPFPTYPSGFPGDLIREFERRSGRGVLGNLPASGTAVLDEYGTEHCRTGKWIVYTSADSVFQVAAHEAVVPLGDLYHACERARELLTGEHAVSRVIARPFRGGPGSWERTPDRKDFSLPPPGSTLLDRLAESGIARLGIGKVDDLFARRAISSTHTATNAEAYARIA